MSEGVDIFFDCYQNPQIILLQICKALGKLNCHTCRTPLNPSGQYLGGFLSSCWLLPQQPSWQELSCDSICTTFSTQPWGIPMSQVLNNAGPTRIPNCRSVLRNAPSSPQAEAIRVLVRFTAGNVRIRVDFAAKRKGFSEPNSQAAELHGAEDWSAGSILGHESEDGQRSSVETFLNSDKCKPLLSIYSAIVASQLAPFKVQSTSCS